MIDELIKRLKAEPDLYYAYQANIAMAFKDECDKRGFNIHFEDLHNTANQAAKNFLDLLCYEPGVHDTTKNTSSTS